MSEFDGRKRVVIESLEPVLDNGVFPIKRVPGETVTVTADIFTDGHDAVAAAVQYRYASETKWHEVPMYKTDNDRWSATFTIDAIEACTYRVCGRIDLFTSWKNAFLKKHEAGQDVSSELQAGIALITATASEMRGIGAKKLNSFAEKIRTSAEAQNTVAIILDTTLAQMMNEHADRSLDSYSREYHINVERPRALFSNWYELFPRSCTDSPERHGTFATCEAHLSDIAAMGFHVVYFPPIHPVGRKNRKGKNNSVTAQPGEPGSPWAIGAKEGGHKSVNPALGTMQDFEHLVAHANSLGLEVALDIAYQCAPDHPYVTAHPQWFRKRPDGSIQYAENPPKKYEDIVPFDFECDDWQALWEELKSVIDFWIAKGVSLFRIDNPHTKPFAFWEWLIAEVKKEHPEILFLAEAFTRPKLMQRLAKIGFSQSYTYFTWRNTKWELTTYLQELSASPLRDCFRPNFWPNTPDILPEVIQFGGRPACILRLLLAGTLSSNYGMYGPALELCVNNALPGREEYADSEKYEIKVWNREAPSSLRDLITRFNAIREQNPALQTTWNIRFFDTDNDALIAFAKTTPDFSNVLFVIANLDPFYTQSGWVNIPYEQYDIPQHQSYLVEDLLTGEKYVWNGTRNFVRLSPHVMPMHLFKVHRKLKRENNFDYYY